MKKTLLFTLCTLFFGTSISAGVGESAVITLIFPYGARACAMGEVGTALADDESALFFNPAGLGIHNKRWQGGSSSYFFEQLLPALFLKELWHSALTGYYQPKLKIIGGFGTFINYLNMGSNLITDALGRQTMEVDSWEAVMATGWGFNFAEYGDTKRHYGITVKPFISALAPGYGPKGEGIARGIAFDIGYLRLLKHGFRMGFTLMNMGPCVYYINQNNRDPLPFTVNVALGYKNLILQNNMRVADISAELRLDKELVINHLDGAPDPFFKAMFKDMFNEPLSYELQEINIHTGFEIGILNTLFYRHGFLIDYIGERYEMTWGFGIRLFNHVEFDFANIHSPEGFLKPLLRSINSEKEGASGVRHEQWRLNFALTYMAKCNKSDLKWWENN